MAKDIPFDEDMMLLFSGIGDPNEPGQHGRTAAPVPTDDAIDTITQIRDLCEDFLMKAGKEDESKKSNEDSEDNEEKNDSEEEI